jgi:hypothetical protein
LECGAPAPLYLFRGYIAQFSQNAYLAKFKSGTGVPQSKALRAKCQGQRCTYNNKRIIIKVRKGLIPIKITITIAMAIYI